MAYRFVINDMEEIDTFSYDTCEKTVPWLSSALRSVFGRHDGGIYADKLAKEMKNIRTWDDWQKTAQRILKHYYRMYCEQEIANDEWYQGLQESVRKDREGVTA
jgi:hypothetical protein